MARDPLVAFHFLFLGQIQMKLNSDYAELYWLIVRVFRICSTSFPSGNHGGGLPLVVNLNRFLVDFELFPCLFLGRFLAYFEPF